MPGAHYAISEALIVAAACAASVDLTRRGYGPGALGLAIFGLAAGIGTYRFASGEIDALAQLHRSVSQIGGVTAMALVAVQCILPSAKERERRWEFIAWAAVAATCVLALVAAQAVVPMFIAWLLIAIVAVIRWPADRYGLRLMRAATMAIFLVNVALVRGSEWLGPDLAWHLYHVLIAVWMVAVWWMLATRDPTIGLRR